MKPWDAVAAAAAWLVYIAVIVCARDILQFFFPKRRSKGKRK
jgi:hypothetical protein